VSGYFDASVVVLGRFNPAIFQPQWFRDHDLIPASEIDSAENNPNRLLVTNDVTALQFESIRLDVQQARWSINTSRQDWKRDLGPIAASIFELLPHTPISLLGFNYSIHRYVVGGKPAALRLLNRWAPVEPLASAVGKRVHIGATVRCDWDAYRVTFTLDSSVRLADGIYVGQNFERKVDGGKALSECLHTDWSKIVKRAEDLIKTIAADEELE
jgi:hypothetical protein